MNKNELMDEIKTRLPDDETNVRTEDIVDTVLQTYADLRLPELQERLKRYEGSQYKTFGKIDELEEMQEL